MNLSHPIDLSVLEYSILNLVVEIPGHYFVYYLSGLDQIIFPKYTVYIQVFITSV